MATQYSIYLSQGSTTVKLPVNPPEYTISNPSDNLNYNVLGVGQMVVPRIPGQMIISWESFFPASDQETAYLTVGTLRQPEYYLNALKRMQESRSPLRLIINRYDESGGGIFDTNIKCIIRRFDQTERGGETGDFYYSIELEEYRDANPDIVNVALPSTVGVPVVNATTVPQREVPRTQIVVGDTVIANGRYYASSYGDNPFGNANNRQTTVTRIVSNPQGGQNYPIHIGNALGWLQLNQLRKV